MCFLTMISNCQYERRGDLWCCPRCGYRTTRAEPPARVCAPGHGGGGGPSGPVVGRCCAGARYLAALARWALAGRPTRDTLQIEQLHAICRVCDHYQADRCQVCGCRVTRERAITNKLYLATEHCPLGRW